MVYGRTATALAVVLAVVAPNPALAQGKSKKAASAPCVSESTMPALNVRALQTELMVAALACGESERYNAFVGSRKDELLPYANMLQTTFAGRTNLLVTKIANNSAHTMDCAAAGSLIDTMLSADHPPLETVATNDWASKRHGYRICTKSLARNAR